MIGSLVQTLSWKIVAMGGDKMSDETKKLIDNKVSKVVDFAYKKTYEIVNANKDILNQISYELVANVTYPSRS